MHVKPFAAGFIWQYPCWNILVACALGCMFDEAWHPCKLEFHTFILCTEYQPKSTHTLTVQSVTCWFTYKHTYVNTHSRYQLMRFLIRKYPMLGGLVGRAEGYFSQEVQGFKPPNGRVLPRPGKYQRPCWLAARIWLGSDNSSRTNNHIFILRLRVVSLTYGPENPVTEKLQVHWDIRCRSKATNQRTEELSAGQCQVQKNWLGFDTNMIMLELQLQPNQWTTLCFRSGCLLWKCYWCVYSLCRPFWGSLDLMFLWWRSALILFISLSCLLQSASAWLAIAKTLNGKQILHSV